MIRRHPPAAPLLLALAVAAAACHADEEFLGPFPSWLDVKRDCGAVGDGKADDTAALQKALGTIRNPDSPKRVMYLPAGTYRITKAIELIRETHTQSQGVTVCGEHPDKVVLRWDGPEGGVMFDYGAWFSVVRRITFDGAGRAKTAIRHGPRFVTANELSDLVVRDVQFGIEAGQEAGIAETAVLRCRFARCAKAAVSIQGFNSLDWYLWQCLFEDCGLGVTNEFGAGNFHVYRSVFLRSTEADVSTKHTGYFTLYGNVSIGSKAFYLGKRHPMWQADETHPANVTLQDNRIIRPADAACVRVGNNGPIFLLDNQVLSAAGAEGPVVVHDCPGEGDLVAVGNTFTVADAIKASGRLVEIDNAVADVTAPDAPPALPGPPHSLGRPVVEVDAGADAAAIQVAIDKAAAMKGRRPVVHLPAASYRVDRTLVIPAGADLQLVGDGIIQATVLNWTGKGPGPVLRVAGPTHATLRDFHVNAGNDAVAIAADNVDQPGASVFMEQAQTSGYGYGLVVDGLDYAGVRLHDHVHNGIRVVGGPALRRGDDVPGRVGLFCGASSRHTHQRPGVHLYGVSGGARLTVRDIWYEGDAWSLLRLTDRGQFTYHAGFVAPNAGIDPKRYESNPWEAEERARRAALEFDGFVGSVLFSQVSTNGATLRVVPPADGLKLLLLGYVTNSGYDLNLDGVKGQVGMLSGRRHLPGRGSESLADGGRTDAAFVREMLAPLRAHKPADPGPPKDGVTDLRIHRVMVMGSEGIRLQGK